MRKTTYHFSLSEMGDCCRAGYEASLLKCKDLHVVSAHISDTTSRELTLTLEDDGKEDLQLLKSEVIRIVCTHFDDCGIDCCSQDLADAPITPVSPLSFLSSHWFLGTVGTGAGVGLLLVCMFVGALPMVAMVPIAIASVLLTLVLGADSFFHALDQFKMGKLTMDSLFFVSTLTAVGVSIAACFVPSLPMMFDAGLMIFGFRHLGEGIKQSLEQTMGLNARFQDRAPKMVKKLINSQFVDTPVEALAVNDEILVEKNVIPVNGICLDAGCDLDISFINGDSVSYRPKCNDPVFAGTTLKAGSNPMRIRVTAITKNSLLAERDDEMAQSLAFKAPLQIETEQGLQYFIPAVFLVALLSAVTVGYFYTAALAIGCAVTVLVTACPCTFSLITSLSMRTGMKKAEDAEHSVQFKTAEELQKASQVDRMVFDLNGTLTIGRPTVTEFKVLDTRFTARQLLSYFAALELHSAHSIGEAIREYVESHDVKPVFSLEKEDIDDKNGSGLKANIDGKLYFLGNKDMMNEYNIRVEPHAIVAHGSAIYLAADNKVLGYAILSAPLRNDALQVISRLKSMGIEPYLCTGDSEETAQRFAKSVGINPENVYFKCRDKPSVIAALEQDATGKRYRVSMVGDAGNDAPAVARSYFGVAVQSRGVDKITRDNAGAVIRGQTLLPLITAIEVAKQTVNNIKQGLWFSLGYNLIAVAVASGLLLTVGVSLTPGMGAALMIVQSSLVLLNMYRFKLQPLTYAVDTAPTPSLFSTFAQVLMGMPGVAQTPQPATCQDSMVVKPLSVSMQVVVNQNRALSLEQDSTLGTYARNSLI